MDHDYLARLPALPIEGLLEVEPLELKHFLNSQAGRNAGPLRRRNIAAASCSSG